MATPTASIIGDGGSSATSPRVVTAAGVAGRTYVAFCTRSSASDPFTAVTDDGGNTWTRVDYTPKSGAVGRRIEQWACKPTTAFTTVSAAFTGAGLAQVSLVEVLGSSGTVNVFNSNFAASTTTPASVQVTPTKANTLVLAAVQANSNTQAQITTAAPYIELTGGSSVGPQVAYYSNPSSGSATGAVFTFTTAQGSGTVILALEEDATTPPPTGSKVSRWDGAARVAHKVSRWDGTTRVAHKIR